MGSNTGNFQGCVKPPVDGEHPGHEEGADSLSGGPVKVGSAIQIGDSNATGLRTDYLRRIDDLDGD